MALAFVVFLVLLGLRRLRAVALAALAVSAGFAATLALLNVDQFIVERNRSRYGQTGDLDVAYLASLSDDAVPGLVDLTRAVDGNLEVQLLAALSCRREQLARRVQSLGWPSYQLSRAAAWGALLTLEDELKAYPITDEPSGVEDPARSAFWVWTPGGYEPCSPPGGF